MMSIFNNIKASDFVKIRELLEERDAIQAELEQKENEFRKSLADLEKRLNGVQKNLAKFEATVSGPVAAVVPRRKKSAVARKAVSPGKPRARRGENRQKILDALKMATDGLTQKELAKITGIAQTAISNMIKKVNGVVKEGGRGGKVRLTPESSSEPATTEPKGTSE